MSWIKNLFPCLRRKERTIFKPSFTAKVWNYIERDIGVSISDYRHSLGLSVLVPDDFIRQQATIRTSYCISVQKVTHDYYGIVVGNVKNAGLSTASEILAYGYSIAKDVVESWIRSDSHRRMMEKPDWVYIGVSVQVDEMNRNYFAVVFAK